MEAIHPLGISVQPRPWLCLPPLAAAACSESLPIGLVRMAVLLLLLALMNRLQQAAKLAMHSGVEMEDEEISGVASQIKNLPMSDIARLQKRRQIEDVCKQVVT
jgi:hypothetical protein